MSITVLTVSIASRQDLLARNIASVYGQTVPVERHLICAHQGGGPNPQVEYSGLKNRLLEAVDTEWIAVLNDDDYWLPNHVQAISPELDEADVIYTWEQSGVKPRENCNAWTQHDLLTTFDRTNHIDGNCAIRTAKLREVGGFPVNWVGPGPWQGGHYEDSPARFEDWELWRRLIRVEGCFLCVPEETWVYGMGAPGQICG
jgi:hypothetical protein